METTTNHEALVEHIATVLRAADKTAAVRYDASTSLLSIGNSPKVFFLERWQRECCGPTSQDHAASLPLLAKRLVEHKFPKKFAQALPRLRVRVMSRIFEILLAAHSALTPQESRTAWIRGRVTRTLDAWLMEDHGTFSLPVPTALLTSWKMKREDVLSQVICQGPATRDYQIHELEGMWMYTASDEYALSFLMLDPRRTNELPDVRPLAVMALKSNLLLCAPQENLDAIDLLYSRAFQSIKTPDIYGSAELQVVLDRTDKWSERPLQLYLDGASMLEKSQFLVQYEVVNSALRKYRERQSSPEPVARCVPICTDDSKMFVLAAVCVLGQRTLLPSADLIAWENPETGKITCMSFRMIVENLPQCLEPSGWAFYWRVRKSPTPSQLEQLAILPEVASRLSRTLQ